MFSSNRIPAATARLSKVNVHRHGAALPQRSSRQSENPALQVLNFRKACDTISAFSTTNSSLRNRSSRTSSISLFSNLYRRTVSTQISSAITTSDNEPRRTQGDSESHQFDRRRGLHRVVVSKEADEDVRIETDHKDSAAPLAIASSISSMVTAVFLLPLNQAFQFLKRAGGRDDCELTLLRFRRTRCGRRHRRPKLPAPGREW